MQALLHRSRVAASLAAVLAVSAGLAYGQFRGGEFMDIPARYMPDVLPDRDFAVCRIQYTRVRREPSGGGWRTDYPYGEINLSIRLSELTRTRVSTTGARNPNHYVVMLTDPAFFDQFSPFGYAMGINVLLHAMTH
jgi:hypothetical protein